MSSTDEHFLVKISFVTFGGDVDLAFIGGIILPIGPRCTFGDVDRLSASSCSLLFNVANGDLQRDAPAPSLGFKSSTSSEIFFNN